MIKRKVIPALAAATFALTAQVYAQERVGAMPEAQEQAQPEGEMPMMGPGMGSMSGGMMGHGMGMTGGGMPAHGMGIGYMMSPGMMQMLGLSTEQKAKISQIQARARKKQWQVMGDLREERIKLHELMSSESAPDPAVATTQYQKVQDLERQLFEETLVARNQVEAVLTPEQKDKLKSGMMAHGMGRQGAGPMHQGGGKN